MDIDTLICAIAFGITILISGIIAFSSIKSSVKSNENDEVEITITYDKVEDKYFVYKNHICIACKETFEEAKSFVDNNKKYLKEQNEVLYKEKL